jgi:hypothetical protein
MPLIYIIASAVARVLMPFAGWLAKFFGSGLLMFLFALVAEFIPRLLGLGQGLVSWGFGLVSSVAFSAFQMSLSAAGVELPSFSSLLAGLPPGLVWAGSAMRIHKVVFIVVSIFIVRILRKAFEALAASAAKGGAASLLAGGK